MSSLSITSVAPVPIASGQKDINLNINGTANIGSIYDANLLAGDNVVIVPSGAIIACIIPPVNNAAIVKLKATGTDSGLLLSLTQPSVITLAANVATFIINVNVNSNGWEVNFPG